LLLMKHSSVAPDRRQSLDFGAEQLERPNVGSR
jgi:hypothetical protein